MGNRIVNASGLDGVTGYQSIGLVAPPRVISIDDSNLGAEGRLAIVSSGAALAGAPALSGIRTDEVAVVAGETLDAFTHFRTVGGTPSVWIQWIDIAHDATTSSPLEITPPRSPPFGALRGRPGGFSFAALRTVVPVGAAFARLTVACVLPQVGDAAAAILVKPFLGPPTLRGRRAAWTPGPHLNPDLALPAWPDILPPAEADSFNYEPVPTRRAFAGETGVPINRPTGANGWGYASFTMVLNAEQFDALGALSRTGGEFWYVRPDTAELCVAEFAEDGDPRDNGGHIGARRTAVRLLLRVS
jgi:hypothetical protein